MTILEKFDGTNFHTWKVKDEDGVVGLGFLECGKHMNELKPSTPITKQITWERKDGQERANILLNLKD
jgi:hypothetical protein